MTETKESDLRRWTPVYVQVGDDGKLVKAGHLMLAPGDDHNAALAGFLRDLADMLEQPGPATSAAG